MDEESKPPENQDSQSDFLRPPIKAKKSRWGFRGKTVWDLLQLLIVPLMLALITVVFTWQQNGRQNELEDQRAREAQKIENQRAKAERARRHPGSHQTARIRGLDVCAEISNTCCRNIILPPFPLKPVACCR